MKKYLSFALALAMFCTVVLTGCGSQSSGSSTAGASGVASAASGDTDWPTGTVTVTLPYSAGGDTDTYCRALFQRVGEKLGQTFVVTNLTGGSGVVAAKEVMSKKNDGYNLLFTHTGAALVQEATGTVDFSYTEDFANCCTVAIDQTYSLVAVAQGGEYGQYSRGWETLKDMIADAKTNPGVVRYSTVFGSTTQYVGQMLERDADVTFDNIDVGSDSATRMAALLGGQVDLLAVNYMNVKDYIESGDLVCLGVMAAEPVDSIDFPTFVEQGYANVVTAKKYEIKFPKGTDQAIIDKLSDACEEVVSDPSFADVLASYFAKPLYRDAATMNTEDPAEVEMLKAGLAG
ncbi:tripartite tricarboxylate transporter substrate binding protein [Oscillibacter sp.]|uniref:tripartite tricarboxylate transporter substrate binding protein n=1 Tax=Oscillibacter sp. TaxID=1945593 RepID=UPI00289FBF70|nr:tripartite tricarboxylate transporter substrate binding protein [Oscillibacter sp.]